MSKIEITNQVKLDFTKITTFKKKEILPVVIQNEKTKEVLLLAYTNQQALEKTLKTKILTLWSTSHQKLWIKGSTSGNLFQLKKAFVNCEQNSLLFLVVPKLEGMCHTKDKQGKYRVSCFYREIDSLNKKLKIIS